MNSHFGTRSANGARAMKVSELIESLSYADPEMEIVDYCQECDEYYGLKRLEIVGPSRCQKMRQFLAEIPYKGYLAFHHN